MFAKSVTIQFLFDTIWYDTIRYDTIRYRGLQSIWDDVTCQFNTTSYIHINSQKATKIWFDNFITELFSGNAKWCHGKFKIKVYLDDSGEMNRCYWIVDWIDVILASCSLCLKKSKIQNWLVSRLKCEGDAKESQQWKYSQLESWMIIWSSCDTIVRYSWSLWY